MRYTVKISDRDDEVFDDWVVALEFVRLLTQRERPSTIVVEREDNTILTTLTLDPKSGLYQKGF